MQRSKSIVEFQQLMRQDAQAALRSELDRLIDNADKEDRDYLANEFTSFANLFERFLQERGSSIQWENIKPPAEGMVSTKLFRPGMTKLFWEPTQLDQNLRKIWKPREFKEFLVPGPVGFDPDGFGPWILASEWA